MNAVDDIAARHGAVLCTVLLQEAPGVFRRAASSRPDAYPVSGSKRFEPPWPAWLVDAAEHHRGRWADGETALRAAFFDHAQIEGLGCTGYCTVPLVVDGRLAGVLSVLGPPGWASEERLTRLRDDAEGRTDLVATAKTGEER